jgi:hypothetical protein
MNAADVEAFGCASVREHGKYIEARRPDGFTIYLDRVNPRDPDYSLLTLLNEIRLRGTPEQVVIAVGLVRGIQIARSYAAKQPDKVNVQQVMKTLTAMLRQKKYRAQIPSRQTKKSAVHR